jgi:hypothetical protein
LAGNEKKKKKVQNNSEIRKPFKNEDAFFFYVKTTLINFGNVCAENTPHQNKFQQLIKHQTTTA